MTSHNNISEIKGYAQKKVLITGGSSGIGLAMAKLLASNGASVVLVARNQANLQASLDLLEALRVAPLQTFEAVSVDVADFDQVARNLRHYIEPDSLPDYIFNAAGVARPGYVEEIPLDVFKWTMDINYHGTVHVVKHFLTPFIVRGNGAFINFSSLAGVIGAFGYTAYAGSKFAVRGFSDALRAEMKPKGIQVTIVYPPDTDTPQLAWEDQFKPYETRVIAGSDKPVSAELVARDVLVAVLKKKKLVVPGTEAKLMHWAATHLGGLVYPVMDMLVATAQKKMAKRR
jgi:3-dehydrosphinganine reductase